jgi:hypothetical protein
MGKPLQHYQYSHLQALFQKLNERLHRHFAKGRFYKFSKRKQAQLLSRIEKLRQQLSILEKGIKLAGISAVAALALSSMDANAQTKIGTEFRVNTETSNKQAYSATAMDADGDFVVVWQSYGQDGDYYGIYAQRYDNTGATVGNEFRVNTTTTGYQSTPAVAMDADGDFVISWNSDQEVALYGIYAQRYDNTGAAVGSEFHVNTEASNNQYSPSVAMDADGDFVIAWESLGQDNAGWGIYAQRYDNTGAAVGTEFRVNTSTGGDQLYASAEMDTDGNFVIVWQSNSAYNTDVYAQRYTNTGATAGTEFRVNTITSGHQTDVSVAMDADGDFVIVWQSNANGSEIVAQRYSNTGATVGSEFQVNTYTTYQQQLPVVAMDSDGDFVICWESNDQDGDDYGVYVQRYDNTGATVGSEFQMSTHTSAAQILSSIAMDSDGDFVVSWQSGYQDGDNYGIYAQRYGVVATGILAGTNNTDLMLYPNPAKSDVFMNLEGTTGVKIMDLSGHVVKELKTGNAFSVSGLPSGTYIVELSQQEQKVSKKLVIE